MKQVIQNNGIFRVADMESANAKLPIGTYNLGFSDMQGFFLEKTEDFKLPSKIYGDTSIVERSIKVYRNCPRNFGLLLSGLRGAGKSLTMKKIALELNQPIIIINENFHDVSSMLIKFLTDPVLGDCTIILDEFEKRFSENDVTPLTLLDGPYNNHHFFILTVNEKNINENLINRPGRIYYHKEYNGLDDDMIREVGMDLLNNQDFLDDLIDTCTEIKNLSFDMLLSIVNDSNLFNEEPSKCIKYFGFDMHESSYVNFYQKIDDELKLINDRPIWINPAAPGYWLDNVMLDTKKGLLPFEVLIHIKDMKKVAPKKYQIVQKLKPSDISCERDSFKSIKTDEIEIYMYVNVPYEVQYAF